MSKYPKDQELSLLYEVVDAEGESQWGGESPAKAIEWYRQAPIGSRLFVSGWDSDDLDAHPVGRALDITELIGAVRGGWIW